ncbi:MAG: hypothetical protein ABW173_07685 [Sphingomonas sp.]
MTDHRLIGRHASAFLHSLGPSLAVPAKPPEGDPEYGLDRYVECPEHGLCVVIDADDLCCCVQFYGAGMDPSYRQYAGDLPGGVRFSDSRDDARTIMGAPMRSSDGGATEFGIEHRPWDLFASNGLRINLGYTAGCERILMVSVMRPPEEG